MIQVLCWYVIRTSRSNVPFLQPTNIKFINLKRDSLPLTLQCNTNHGESPTYLVGEGKGSEREGDIPNWPREEQGRATGHVVHGPSWTDPNPKLHANQVITFSWHGLIAGTKFHDPIMFE